jgi:hypothetical protein
MFDPPSSPGFGVVRRIDDPLNFGPESLVGNMTYHDGPVQHTQKVFTIFWNGPPGGFPPFPTGYQSTINQFVQDLNGSSYYAIASQYNDGTGFISTAVLYGGTWLDTVNSFSANRPRLW